MDIIFEYDDKRLILPVNPESVKVSTSSASQKVDVIGIGQVSVPQTAELSQISIKSFFWKYLFDSTILRLAEVYLPSSASSTVSSAVSKVNSLATNVLGSSLVDDSKKFKLLNEYVQWFNTWRDSKKPARWTIVVPPNEPPQCLDFYVTCERFDYEVIAGEETDYYYELELLEWRDYGAEEVETKEVNGKITANPKTPARLDTKAELAPKFMVKAKDTLWSLAKQNSAGELEGWKTLYNIAENKSIIANNLSSLSGKVLKTPTEWMNL